MPWVVGGYPVTVNLDSDLEYRSSSRHGRARKGSSISQGKTELTNRLDVKKRQKEKP
jgi:hypothetical protein